MDLRDYVVGRVPSRGAICFFHQPSRCCVELNGGNRLGSRALAATIFSLICLVISARPVLGQARFVPYALYDFESPALVLDSALDFHDNWSQTFSGLSGPFLKIGGGFDTTRVAQGGSATQGGRRDLNGSRFNDGNFSFPNFQYNETLDQAAVVQADIRYTDDL
jgi:hypothetical protein